MVPRKMGSLNSLPIKLSLLSEFFNLCRRGEIPCIILNAPCKYHQVEYPRHCTNTARDQGETKAKTATYIHKTMCIFKQKLKESSLSTMQLFYFRTAGREKFAAAKKNTDTYFFLQLKLHKYSMNYYNF